MNTAHSFHNRIPLKTNLGLDLFEASDIIYFFIESCKVNVLLIDGRSIRIFHTLTELESSLAELHFYRCHAARLINLDHVKRYNHKTCIVELTTNLSVKVASYRKVEFKTLLFSILPPPLHYNMRDNNKLAKRNNM